MGQWLLTSTAIASAVMTLAITSRKVALDPPALGRGSTSYTSAGGVAHEPSVAPRVALPPATVPSTARPDAASGAGATTTGAAVEAPGSPTDAPHPSARPQRRDRAAEVATVRSSAPTHTSTPNHPDRDFMFRYQRVGRALMAMQQRMGYAFTSDVLAEFRAIDLETAFTTARARRELADELTRLEAVIDRNRAIEVTDDCRNNPLAASCR
jgi:hypothetical protein